VLSAWLLLGLRWVGLLWFLPWGADPSLDLAVKQKVRKNCAYMRLQAHIYSTGMADGSTGLGLGHHFRGADFWLILVLPVGLAYVTIYIPSITHSWLVLSCGDEHDCFKLSLQRAPNKARRQVEQFMLMAAAH
jgi:hypothetical protein